MLGVGQTYKFKTARLTLTTNTQLTLSENTPIQVPDQVFNGLSDDERDSIQAQIDRSNQAHVGYYKAQAKLLHDLKESLPHGNWTALINSGVLPFANATEISRLVRAHEWFEDSQLSDNQLQNIKLRSAQMVAKAGPEVQQKVEALLADGQRVTQQTVEELIGIKREPKEPTVSTTDKLDLALEANDKLRDDLKQSRHQFVNACERARDLESYKRAYHSSSTETGWIYAATSNAKVHGKRMTDEAKFNALIEIAEALGCDMTKELKGAVGAMICKTSDLELEGQKALSPEEMIIGGLAGMLDEIENA